MPVLTTKSTNKIAAGSNHSLAIKKGGNLLARRIQMGGITWLAKVVVRSFLPTSRKFYQFHGGVCISYCDGAIHRLVFRDFLHSCSGKCRHWRRPKNNPAIIGQPFIRFFGSANLSDHFLCCHRRDNKKCVMPIRCLI